MVLCLLQEVYFLQVRYLLGVFSFLPVLYSLELLFPLEVLSCLFFLHVPYLLQIVYLLEVFDLLWEIDVDVDFNEGPWYFDCSSVANYWKWTSKLSCAVNELLLFLWRNAFGEGTTATEFFDVACAGMFGRAFSVVGSTSRASNSATCRLSVFLFIRTITH